MSAKTNSSAVVNTGFTAKLEHRLEGLLFNRRVAWLLVFAALSLLLGWQASRLQPDASFQKMVPAQHPFVLNYLRYENDLRPLGNNVRIVVENTTGEIYSAEYLAKLKKINDEVFYIPGVDRGNLRSLWTPNTLWMEVTEEGWRVGPIVPAGYTGSPQQVAAVRDNVAKAGLIGSLVADDQKSAVILVPLLELDPQTGEKLDYALFSQRLETLVRAKYQGPDTRIHIVGFAKLVGDLIAGASAIGLFFLLTVGLTTALVYVYSRCWRSTLATIGCCLLAVVWHLGVMRSLGFGLDPYSILVPFLTFAIGVSHAVQNINTLAHETLAGASRMDAAKATFRLLFIPGTVALLCDVVGFSTLLIIDIGVIRELAISASVGVFVIIFTKMFLLPVLMSYAGLSAGGLQMARRRAGGRHRLAAALAALTVPRNAWAVVGLSAALATAGWVISRDLQIGDLDPGAPELRPDSTYNRDAAFLSDRYSSSTDVFVVMVGAAARECNAYTTASTVTRLQWALEEVPEVQGTFSMFNLMGQLYAANYGGDIRWATMTRNRFAANAATTSIPQSLYNSDCSMVPVIAYLSDHKAPTLNAVVGAVQAFQAAEPTGHAQILMAAGNSGIEAATNQVVHKAWLPMLALVYGIVGALLLLEFRSFRVMLCLLIPLAITSLLCEAIMTRMGLGVKVATLPVIALGVGIGVDYGIYLYNRLEQYLERGLELRQAYFETMKSTGLAVAFTGITLGAGVCTWVFSEIKFQADMGLLLTFMFLWNMLGAIALVPALARVLGIGTHGAKPVPALAAG